MKKKERKSKNVFSLKSICFRYRPDRTRLDGIPSFTYTAIEKSGAYGTMLALTLLSEIAFQNGKMPKFGA